MSSQLMFPFLMSPLPCQALLHLLLLCLPPLLLLHLLLLLLHLLLLLLHLLLLLLLILLNTGAGAGGESSTSGEGSELL